MSVFFTIAKSGETLIVRENGESKFGIKLAYNIFYRKM